MKKEVAENIVKQLEKKIKAFTHNLRSGSYLVRYVDPIENPIHSNDFHVYVGFQKIGKERIILDPYKLFVEQHKLIE
jgi:hypothetical protein